MEHVWDSHIHLFPQRLFQAIWDWFEGAGWEIPYSGADPETLTSQLQDTGAERAFVLPYAHKPDISLELNRWLRDFCRDRPGLIPFASVHPEDENLERNLATALDDWGFAGVKLQLAVLRIRADDPRLFPVYWAALQRQKPVVIHAGTAPYPQESPEYRCLGLERLKPVLEAMPRLRLVIPHLGMDQLDLAAHLLESYPGVHLDTSWALGNPLSGLDRSRAESLMRAHPDRILHGTDFPLIQHSPEDCLRELRQLELEPQIRERILWKNAFRLVGLQDDSCAQAE